MQPKKMLSPDATNPGSNTSTKSKKSSKSYNPYATSDMVAVNKKINEKWISMPEVTLFWITQQDFEKIVNEFTRAVSEQSTNASSRPAGTQSLKQMDILMDETVRIVKKAIDLKFTDAARAQYARYGIIKENSNYRLAKDRNLRLANLDLMLSSLSTDGFADESWGITFWTDMKINYGEALKADIDSRGSISAGSGNIANMMKQLRKVNTALRYVLRGNYPDSYQQVYRDWGWQRESY